MKKFLAIVLALACVLSLCACTGNGGNGGSGDSGSNGGGGENANPDEKVQLSIGIGTNALVLDHKNNALTKWVEEQCNVELTFEEYSGGSDVATQISTTIAGRKELPDILFGVGLTEDVYERYGREGYFVDLVDYYADKEGASKTFWDRMTNELSESDQETVLKKITDTETGGIYGVPSVETSLVDSMNVQPFINQTWLDKLNLKAPTNPEELLNVLRAFKTKDPNGNGIPDEIPLFGSQKGGLGAKVVDWLINMFCYYNSSNPYNVGKDGKLYPAFTTDGYREGLKFVNKLYEEGLLTSMAWTAKSSEMKQIITPAAGEPVCGIFLGHLTSVTSKDNPILYQYVPLKHMGYVIRSKVTCNMKTFITESCDNVDKAFEVLMTLWSWEGSMRVRYGEYGVNWTDADPGAKSYFGLDATYKLIQDPLGSQTTAKWAAIASCLNINAEGESAQIDPNSSEWLAKKSALHGQSYANFLEQETNYNDPSLVCPELVKSDAEVERTAVANTNIADRRNKAQTEFCTGVLDPYSDADWNAYLKEMDDLGIQIVLETNQVAYDRDYK